MKISIKLDVSHSSGHRTVSLGDLGITDEDWQNMSSSEKEETLTEYIDGLTEQPCWIIESFDEI